MSEISNRKSQITCRNNSGSITKASGFKVSLASVPKHKFGVHYAPLKESWRVTELTTGWAIPGSDAYDKEAAVKNAEREIAKFNQKYDAFGAAVLISKKMNIRFNPTK